jgi:O-antigen chain-terminating methyltransferase
LSQDPIQDDQLLAAIREVRDRAASRHRNGANPAEIRVDLMPLVHARDAAEAKVAAIGSVNPRRGGAVNNFIQWTKRKVARALNWYVRDQVDFNRAMMACVQSTIEAINDLQRSSSEASTALQSSSAILQQEMVDFAARNDTRDIRTHWQDWRLAFEDRRNQNEIHLLRTVSELQASFGLRVSLLEQSLREAMRQQHNAYESELDRRTDEIQQRLWQDLEKVRKEYEELIYRELRIVRQRLASPLANASPASTVQPVGQNAAATPVAVPAAPEIAAQIDWLRFADRFRGSEEHIRAHQQMYLDRFTANTVSKIGEILDIGCGRGEFLEAAASAGLTVQGIDLSAESVAVCQSKGLHAEVADLFPYLDTKADASVDGVYCSQVVEHIDALKLPNFIHLLGKKVRPGGLVAFETPNPECLAIFATHFYIDPTHVRPVPSVLLRFYLEEAGFTDFEVVRLSPAAESFPALNDLPTSVRDGFFGGLDYALFAKKL